MNNYRLRIGNSSIVLGNELNVEAMTAQPPVSTIVQHDNGAVDWNLPVGVYRAKDIVRELDTLLEAVLVQLGRAADAEALLYNLQANLAIAGRESDLPLEQLALETKSGIELTRQAQRIGESISRWAREFNAEKWAFETYGSSTLDHLHFRSHCDNHLWTHRVANLLMGPAGSPVVMQLFNEYLHQAILLRDALLPFENWEEVPIKITADSSRGKGMRFVERGRAEFFSKLLGKRMSHKAIVQFAQSVLSPELLTVGYGFQYRLGAILPASLCSEPLNASRYLLRWYPVQMVMTGNGDKSTPVAFDYEYSDYYAAPRSQTAVGSQIAGLQLPDQELKSIDEALIVPSGDQERVVLHYKLHIKSAEYTVDLGQAFRGHRFMYRPIANPGSDSERTTGTPSDMNSHYTHDILSLHGLVTNESGTHFISADGNPLVLWALLGKLYPENVVLLEGVREQELQNASRSGKGFGTKFLIC
ncbi:MULTISPECIES: hypothetical protein [Paenibacillus]|uniref:hypothetical protein n=1 Tax=Paenibacillus TaxID=44249 RepID=UPI00096E0B8E|nr:MULTISPECIES: hypothetical protein [Paenibacillus]OMD22986.1 hypothetical protein BJP48_27895 [Paenibacillus odorifer]OME08090.1 hypothetical protein BSK60_30545 [Paenibacillus odorifer]OMF86060.1 hypothetical protein BK147_30810 [Paenibacillus sp. FSL R7-0337]